MQVHIICAVTNPPDILKLYFYTTMMTHTTKGYNNFSTRNSFDY